MLLSMTGYGSDVYTTDYFTLEIEIKSLNSRFLDLSVRLPKELNQHEFAIRDFIKSKIIRGKVSIFISLTLNSSKSDDASLDKDELKRTYKLLSTIKQETGYKEDLSINHLLLFRDNFLNQKQEDITIEIDDLIKPLGNALDNLIQMRGAEGTELKKDLVLRIDNINCTLAKIEDMAKKATQEYFNKFKEKAKKLSAEFVDDMDRFLIELAILSEKHDVTEECTRLHSHIKLFKDTMQNINDVGRKLNFICQEMNREINTINSKSISSEISHLGINIKEELEKIREQVQNIE